MSSSIKEIGSKLSIVNAEDALFSNAASRYLEGKTEKIIELTNCISEISDYNFVKGITGNRTLIYHRPTIDQLKACDARHNTSPLPQAFSPEWYQYFSSMTREEFLNSNVVGLINADSLIAFYNSDNPHSNDRTVFDAFTFCLMTALSDKCIKLKVDKMVWDRDTDVDIRDWYIRQDTDSVQPEWLYLAINKEETNTWVEMDETDDVDYSKKWKNAPQTPTQMRLWVGNWHGEPTIQSRGIEPVLHDKAGSSTNTLVGIYNSFWSVNIEGHTVSLHGGIEGESENGFPTPIATYKDGEDVTLIDIFVAIGYSVLNRYQLWEFEDTTREDYILPTLQDVQAIMQNKDIDDTQFLVKNGYYTKFSDIAYPYIVNEWHFQKDDGLGIDSEDTLKVNCYNINNNKDIIQIPISDIYTALETNLTSYLAYSQMMSVYDETKTPGENMQSMLAALQAKGLKLNENASNLLDTVRINANVPARSLFGNILSMFGYDDVPTSDGTVKLSTSKMDEYTGSSSAIASFTTAKNSLVGTARLAGPAMKKIGKTLLSIGKRAWNTVKNTAADYLGIKNKPITYHKASDNTIDNTYFSFKFNGASVNDGLNRMCVLPWEIDLSSGTMKWTQVTESYLKNTTGMTNWFSDNSEIHTLSEMLGLGKDVNRSSMIDNFLKKLWNHSPEIMHISATCAEIYIQCDAKNDDYLTASYIMQIKWKPTTPVTKMSQITMPDNYTNGDLIETYFSQYANSQPINLKEASAKQVKKYIESAKTAFFMSILAPYYMFEIDNLLIHGSGEQNRAGINLLFDIALTIGFSDEYQTISGLPCWMKHNPTDIQDDAVTNKTMVEMGCRASRMTSSSPDGYFFIPAADSMPYDKNNRVAFWNPFTVESFTYSLDDATRGQWSVVPSNDTYRHNYNNVYITNILLYWLAEQVEDDETFIPYEWTTSPSVGSYRIQTDNEESEELAIGLTTAIATATAIIIGGTVLTKKLVSTIKLKKANQLVTDLQWTRSDLANTAKNCDFVMEDAKAQYDSGNLTKEAYDAIVSEQTQKKVTTMSRYTDVIKQERKATRKARRMGKWAFGSANALAPAAIAADSVKSLNDNNFFGIQSITDASNSISKNMDVTSDKVTYIKEHI